MGYNIVAVFFGKLEQVKKLHEVLFGFYKRHKESDGEGNIPLYDVIHEDERFNVSDLVDEEERAKYPTDVKMGYVCNDICEKPDTAKCKSHFVMTALSEDAAPHMGLLELYAKAYDCGLVFEFEDVRNKVFINTDKDWNYFDHPPFKWLQNQRYFIRDKANDLKKYPFDDIVDYVANMSDMEEEDKEPFIKSVRERGYGMFHVGDTVNEFFYYTPYYNGREEVQSK